MENVKAKKFYQEVLNTPQEQVEEVPDRHAVYSMLDDVTSSCLPTCIPEDIRDEMITNAKRLIEIKDARKAFNNIDFEVPRDPTSRALTLTYEQERCSFV